MTHSADSFGADPVLADLVEELAGKLQAGAAVDLEAYAREHPAHAERLRQLWPTVHVLAGLGDAPADPLADRPADRELGDFRIVREVGRGGMGVVYEAEQISLGRRVALKVLPFLAALDAKQLQRFQHEARAAAQLHHPHIVPVYAVGCERGVHYYAMQFVDGQSLAGVVSELRNAAIRGLTPPARRGDTLPLAALPTEHAPNSPAFFLAVARLGVQAAQALEHAHQLGVVHRDVKPANLLLDGRGHLWVADFGLARVRNDNGLTVTGDLVGTLRYMSPEQGSAQRGLVDQRADVYSLGATLYELLTLEPVFGGRDRHELLRQITFDEPVPPRRRNRDVPADLETVVLKAVAKEPRERYATAQELADDLRRFLEHKPITARPPTLVQRAARWVRRHQAVAAAAVIVLALAAVALAVSTVLIGREKVEKEEAYQAEARERREKEAALEAEARQRAEAEAKKQFARRAVDELFLEAERWLVHETQKERLQEFLAKVLEFYEEFARDQGDNPEARRAAGLAYYRVGWIQGKLGRHREAEAAHRQALDLLEKRQPDLPDEPEYRLARAVNHQGLGMVLRHTGRLEEAEPALRRALALYDGLPDGLPRSAVYREGHAWCQQSLGSVLRAAGRSREAEQAFRQALALLDGLPAGAPEAVRVGARATAQHDLADFLSARGQYREAEEVFRRAVASQEKLTALFPTVPGYRYDLALIRNNLAILLSTTGRCHEAVKAYRQAVEVLEKLAADFPSFSAYRTTLAESLDHLGGALLEAGQPRQAEPALLRAISFSEKLAADSPAVPVHRRDLATSHYNLAGVLQATGRPREAEQACRKAFDLSTRLAADFPGTPEYRQDLAKVQQGLGGLLAQRGRLAEAESAHRRALALYAKLEADAPGDPEGLRNLAGGHAKLADVLRQAGRFREAEAAYHEALRLVTRLTAEFPDRPQYRDDLADTLMNWGRLLENAGRAAEAERACRRALDEYGKLVAGSPDTPGYRQKLAACHNNLGHVLAGPACLVEKERAFCRAAALQEQLVADLPDVPPYRSDLVTSLANLARLRRDQGRLAEARQVMGQALRHQQLVCQADPQRLREQDRLHACHAEMAQLFLRQGDHAEAARAVNEMLTTSAVHWQHACRACEALAECAALAEKDAALSPADRQARADAYVGRAEGLLRELYRKGMDDPGVQNGLAWFWATCPLARLRDPARAVELAKQAVGREPHKAAYWTTLGAAHYRAGDAEAAAAALQKSLSLRPNADGLDWFLLAMACRRLGAEDQARCWYHRAAAWAEANRPGDEELRRFRAEAAALLGVPVSPGANEKENAPPPESPETPR